VTDTRRNRAISGRRGRRRERAIIAPTVRPLTLVNARAALTGKHDTLMRTAPGWQGAPDGQQAKKISCYKMFILL